MSYVSLCFEKGVRVAVPSLLLAGSWCQHSDPYAWTEVTHKSLLNKLDSVPVGTLKNVLIKVKQQSKLNQFINYENCLAKWHVVNCLWRLDTISFAKYLNNSLSQYETIHFEMDLSSSMEFLFWTKTLLLFIRPPFHQNKSILHPALLWLFSWYLEWHHKLTELHKLECACFYYPRSLANTILKYKDVFFSFLQPSLFSFCKILCNSCMVIIILVAECSLEFPWDILTLTFKIQILRWFYIMPFMILDTLKRISYIIANMLFFIS